MADIHTQLEECHEQCQKLVEEIDRFNQARSLHGQAIDAIEATCKALQETASRIKPFTDVHIKRYIIGAVSGIAFNTVLVGIVLWKLFFGG